MFNPSSPWSTLRILIAEDNLVNQKILKRILERLEVGSIAIVGNGEEAVRREAAEQFDLVLMDMQMPVMDGIEACRAILQRPYGHPIARVVFVTAHVVDSFQQTCIDNGAIGFIAKPCTLKDVEAALVFIRQSCSGPAEYSSGLQVHQDSIMQY
jgi:CheY-like chemotaxis protein